MRVERILDADANRAAEGLRVLEEVARFLGDDRAQAAALKDLRHRLRAAIPASASARRDTPGDVGTAIAAADEARRSDLASIIHANARRAQEALRALEEFAKLAGLDAPAFEAMRYACYTAESDLLGRLPQQRLRAVRLYALIDIALCEDPVAVAAAVARGGAGAVQLRAKRLDPRRYLELAERMQAAVRAAGALFVVNDHVAVAAALGSDGVHIGQDDLPPAHVRRVVGPGCAIGLSVHASEQLAPARSGAVDYIGLGPVFATATKPHEPVRGPTLLRQVAAESLPPSFAIGGITLERLPALLDLLPHGVAVAGDLCRAADPQARAAAYRALLDG